MKRVISSEFMSRREGDGRVDVVCGFRVNEACSSLKGPEFTSATDLHGKTNGNTEISK